MPVVASAGFNNAVRRSPFFLRFLFSISCISIGEDATAPTETVPMASRPLGLLAVDNISGESAKRHDGQDADSSYSGFDFHDVHLVESFCWGALFRDPHHKTKYTLITKNINTMLIVLCVNSYNGLRFL